jgi:hypothetical protein
MPETADVPEAHASALLSFAYGRCTCSRSAQGAAKTSGNRGPREDRANPSTSATTNPRQKAGSCRIGIAPGRDGPVKAAELDFGRARDAQVHYALCDLRQGRRTQQGRRASGSRPGNSQAGVTISHQTCFYARPAAADPPGEPPARTSSGPWPIRVTRPPPWPESAQHPRGADDVR